MLPVAADGRRRRGRGSRSGSRPSATRSRGWRSRCGGARDRRAGAALRPRPARGVEHAAVGLVALGIATAVVRPRGDLPGAGVPESPRTGCTSPALRCLGRCRRSSSSGSCSTSWSIVSVAGAFSAKIHEQLGTRRHALCWWRCVTERARRSPCRPCPSLCGLLVQLARTPRAADRVNVLGARASPPWSRSRERRRPGSRRARGLHGSWYRPRRRDRRVLSRGGRGRRAGAARWSRRPTSREPARASSRARRARAWYYPAFTCSGLRCSRCRW